MNQGYLIAFWTIVCKEIARFSKLWMQTLLPPAITTILYFMIFGNLIGSRIGDMEGFSYAQYIAPGLIMMSVISNSYANTVSSFYGSKFSHYIEELLVAPVPNYLILLGFMAGGLARGLAVGVIVTIISAFFTHLEITHFLVTILIFFLTSSVFSLAGLINGVYAESFDDISIVPTFILTPMTYLGGVFYSISMLPPIWETLSYLNPVLYMVSAFRFGMLGVSDISVFVSIGLLVILVMVLFSFALYLLNKGIGLKS